MSLSNFIYKNRAGVYLSLSILIVLILSSIAFYYGYKVHSSIIRADEWRFLEFYLMPLYDGTFTWKLLFSDHHPIPLDGILFIGNALWFDLNGDLFFYVGIFFKILFFILLTFLIKKSFSDKNMLFFVAILLVGSVWFSLKSSIEYSWPLVTRANLWFFLYLVILYFVDSYFAKDKQKNKNLIFIFLFSLLLMFINKDIAILMFASILVIAILSLVLNHKKEESIKLLVVLGLVFILYKLFWYGFSLNDLQQYKNSMKLDFGKLSFVSFFDSYSLALLSGLIKIQFLKQTIPTTFILALGYLLFAVYLITILYSFYSKLFIKTIIPLALMLFPLFYILGVLLFRYLPIENEINWLITSPRFIKVYEVGIIGMFWNLLLLKENKIIFKALKMPLYVFIFLIFLVNIFTMKNTIESSVYIEKANKNAEALLLHYNGEPNSIPKWVRGGFFSNEKVEFLRKYKLNIFSDRYIKVEDR